MDLLKNKLIESNAIDSNEILDISKVKELLINKFNEIDYNDAKEDVKPFIKNVDSLNMWGKEFFVSITENIK